MPSVLARSRAANSNRGAFSVTPSRVPTTTPPPSALRAALFHALLKSAEKEAVRADLTGGSAYVIAVRIAGTVDGLKVSHTLAGRLTVGADYTRSASATPSIDRVVAAILGKLNTKTREAVMRDLVAEFTANSGELPDAGSGVAEEAAQFLSRLRATKSVDARGPVSFRPGPVLNVVG